MSDLRAFRIGLALSQEGMAKLLGVERAHLSRLERGERNITGEQTIRFNILRSFAREAVLRDAMRAVISEGAAAVSMVMQARREA